MLMRRTAATTCHCRRGGCDMTIHRRRGTVRPLSSGGNGRTDARQEKDPSEKMRVREREIVDIIIMMMKIIDDNRCETGQSRRSSCNVSRQ